MQEEHTTPPTPPKMVTATTAPANTDIDTPQQPPQPTTPPTQEDNHSKQSMQSATDPKKKDAKPSPKPLLNPSSKSTYVAKAKEAIISKSSSAAAKSLSAIDAPPPPLIVKLKEQLGNLREINNLKKLLESKDTYNYQERLQLLAHLEVKIVTKREELVYKRQNLNETPFKQIQLQIDALDSVIFLISRE